MLRKPKVDDGLLELFEEAGRNNQRAALLLRDLLAEFPERAGLARDLLLCEQEGDRIAHDLLHRLNGRPARGGWLEAADVYELTRALDDIVDFAEEAADQMGLYGVEATMEQAISMAEILVDSTEQVAQALRALRTSDDLSTNLVEVHRLENEGDRVARDAIASLFASGIDPMVVIRWKDIFESLEQAVDACETVAHVLEGIALKRARG